MVEFCVLTSQSIQTKGSVDRVKAMVDDFESGFELESTLELLFLVPGLI